MDKKNEPKLIQNRIDLKCATYLTLNNAIDMFKSDDSKEISVSKNIKVSIFTSFGIIIGTVIHKFSLEDTTIEDTTKAFCYTIFDKVIESRNSKFKELEEQNIDLKLINDSSVIFLEDTVILPYANPISKFKVGYFMVFGDEIKGLSVGELS